MTSAALSMSGDDYEVFLKQTPAQKKILLVDDQPEMSLFLSLQQEGHEVTAVASPQRAFSLVWTLRPHFIIIHLANPNRADVSSLQGCSVLAGRVPFIIAAPLSGNEGIIKALKEVAPVCLAFPLGPHGIRRILSFFQCGFLQV